MVHHGHKPPLRRLGLREPSTRRLFTMARCGSWGVGTALPLFMIFGTRQMAHHGPALPRWLRGPCHSISPQRSMGERCGFSEAPRTARHGIRATAPTGHGQLRRLNGHLGLAILRSSITAESGSSRMMYGHPRMVATGRSQHTPTRGGTSDMAIRRSSITARFG